MAPRAARRLSPGRALIALTAGVVVLALPLLNVVMAGTVARVLGCRLDEAGSYPCPVLGVDIGGVLAIMGISGWLMLVTLPFLAVLVPVWLLVALWALVRRWRGDWTGGV